MAKINFVNYGIGADLSKDSLHGCFSGITEQGNMVVIAQKNLKIIILVIRNLKNG